MEPDMKHGREILLASVSFVVLMALAVDPQLALLALWLLPFPMIVFQVIGQKWVTLGLACFIAVFLFVMGFGLTSILCALGAYFMALVMGESIRNAESPFAPLITGTLVVIMLILVLLALVHWSGFDFSSALMHDIETLVSQEKSMFNLDNSAAASLVTEITQWIHMMIPSVICIMAFLIAALNLLLARWMVQSRKRVLPPLLLNWRLPHSTVLVYVFALASVMFGWGKGDGLWWQMANNVAFMAGFFIGIQGIAFLWRKIQRLSGRHILLGLIIVLAAGRYVGSIYILLGLVDSMNNVRRAR